MPFFWFLAICTFDFIRGRTGKNGLGLGCLEVREGRGGVSEGWGRYAVFGEEDMRDVILVGKIEHSCCYRAPVYAKQEACLGSIVLR